MSMMIDSYVSLRNWRDSEIENHQMDSSELNHLHDGVMKNVFDIAKDKVKDGYGPPPCQFSWFVMGSAGRFEQAIISDQDHGLLYEVANEGNKEYFQKLGEEISLGLHAVGYPYCDGNVMSSNPVWCRSREDWTSQFTKWLEDESFESIRFLLIFYDARVLVGKEEFVAELKQQIHDYIKKKPIFLDRLLENTLHYKKAVGIFHQFLTETHGSHTGSIDLKHSGFFPYVNAIRLLAIKEQVTTASTLSRINELSRFPKYKNDLKMYPADFDKLLQYRLKQHKTRTEFYDDVHYLDVRLLNPIEKKELKHILKNGRKLQEYTKDIIKGTLEQ